MPPPPPPPRRPSGGAAASSAGKTPVAHRTRSGRSRVPPPPAATNVGNNAPTGPTVHPRPAAPAAPSMPPPTSGGATTFEPGSAAHVDDAIARRRAELRRLQQQNRGGGLARARYAFGAAPSNDAPPASATISQPPNKAMKYRPPPRPAVTSASGAGVAGASTPTAPAVAAAKATPPTDVVKRRLEGSYGPHPSVPRAGGPPLQQQPIIQQQPVLHHGAQQRGARQQRAPPPQSQNEQRREWQQRQRSKSQPPPQRGNKKRDSEIFAAGKKRRESRQQQPPTASAQYAATPSAQYAATATVSAPAARSATGATAARSAGGASIGYAGSFEGESGQTYLRNSVLSRLAANSPRSPFGQPRKVATPVIPDGTSVPFPVMPGLLAEEPVEPEVAGVVAAETAGGAEPEVAAWAEPSVEAEVAAWVEQHSPTAPKETKQRISMLDSGKSTPVHSNVHPNVALAVEKAKLATEEVPGAAAAAGGEESVSRLVEDLRRTEQEKRAALDQVDKLKTMLEGRKQQTQEEQEETRPKKKMTGSLLDQFREMISTHGESAAVAWIAERLERGDDDDDESSPDPPPTTRRGRSASLDDGDLLASVVPPLTPRSRPGSRAASPERGGLLLSSSLGANLNELDGGGRGKRTTTPLPKRLHGTSPDADGGTGEGGSVVEGEYLAAAARTIPNEYGTRLASYFVRRPYVDADAGGDDAWERYPHLMNEEEYRRTAAAAAPDSLEVLARVEADGSIFTLTGACDARHGRPGGTGEEREWTAFEDVEGREKALGRVTYIDAEGNERDYWLDSIYEEALTTRESYCMSLIAAAFALKEVTGGSVATFPVPSAAAHPPAFAPVPNPPQTMQPPSPMVPQPMPAAAFAQPAENADLPPMMPAGNDVQQPPTLPPTVQPYDAVPPKQSPPACESTMPLPTAEVPPASLPGIARDRPSPERKRAPQQEESKPQQRPQTQPEPKPPAAKQQPPPEEAFEPADSALPFLIVSLFSLLFSMAWFVVKIPFRIGSTLFAFWVAVVALRIVWLFFADDHGAYEMGAGIDWEYNMPGIH